MKHEHGKPHVPFPKTAPAGNLSSWVRTLRARERPDRGVSDGLVYRTRDQARSKAAWYRRKLRERGIEVESVTRPGYAMERWRFVLWMRGNRPGRAVERVVAEKARAQAEREAVSIERGWR